MATQENSSKTIARDLKPDQEYSKTIARDLKPNQCLVLAAWSLTLVAFFFCLYGLLGVWWTGTYEQPTGQTNIQVAYTSTLWETTLDGGTSYTVTQKINESCNRNELRKANCRKINAMRVFLCLRFFAVLLALACPVVWFVLQRLHWDDASSPWRRHLLPISIACKVFASLCAFVAGCIGPSLEFSYLSDGVRAAGSGYVLTILSAVFCLWPAIVLEGLYVWKNKHRVAGGHPWGRVRALTQESLSSSIGSRVPPSEDVVNEQAV